MILPSIPRCRGLAAGVFVCSLLLAGCKPASPPSIGEATPQPQGSVAPHQPTADDLKAFLQTLFPPAIKLSEVKSDTPTRMPNTAPADNTWLLNVKITLTPAEDLLSLPAQQDADAINALVNELNGLVVWRNAYANSVYAHTYGAFDVQVPPGPVPQLLVVAQSKDKPLAPLYGKVAAEWQVDHWRFTNIDLEMPEVGKLRSSFSGPTIVQGRAEAEAFLTAERKAIADTKDKRASIEDRYARDLAAAVKPGTVYKGQISQASGVLPCEVRFTDTPGADPQMATFEVRVPSEPAYLFTYSARLAPKVPLNLGNAATASGEAGVPVGNLTVSFVRGVGKASAFGSLAGVMRVGAGGCTDKPFLLLDGHLKGVVSSFNGDFTLNASATH